MTRVALLVMVMCIVLALGGCFPERVVWAPNGERAAVIGKDGGVYLCDSDGKLSGPVLGGVAYVAWFPDSERFIAVSWKELKSWKEIEPLLPEERKKKLIETAERYRGEILSYNGDWSAFKPESIQGRPANELSTIKIYLRDAHAEGLAEKLGERWKEFENASGSVSLLQVCLAAKEGPQAGTVLAQTPDHIISIRMSPNGKAVAYTQSQSDEWYKDKLALFVLPTDGSAGSRMVAESVAVYPDWSADGLNLVYAATPGSGSGSDAAQLGTITERPVCDANGALLKDFPGTKDLAGIVFNMISTRVRCLRDGRILFSSAEVWLPATAGDMPQRFSLFAVDPMRQPTVTRVLPRTAEAMLGNLILFEVNQDGTEVAILQEEGVVSVVTLATGQVLTVQPDKDTGNQMGGGPVRTVPSWRSANELCFAVPRGSKYGSPNRAEIVLWSSGDYRCISKDWPDSAVEDLLK